MIPRLSPAALSLSLGAGQPGFGQAAGDGVADETDEEKRRRLMQQKQQQFLPGALSPAAQSLGLGTTP
ncbi:hypothetical protein JIR23_21200 [Bradyrhizobium diazoefficiens]|nr:hypothetical protein [Bradyrhizobium diazoefficiens]QQN62118.1 hypothetical protein JIR23_21200 [Bradyrhizobium diazoefficiens]